MGRRLRSGKDLLASVPPITFLLIQLVPSVCVLWVLVLATGTVRWHGVIPLALLKLLKSWTVVYVEYAGVD